MPSTSGGTTNRDRMVLGNDWYKCPETEPTMWPESRRPSTAAPMIPNAFPPNAAGHARYCRYEKSACSRRCIASIEGVTGMCFGLLVVPLVCA